MNCYSVSSHSFFCYGFFQNCLSILFFNIEVVDNYNCGFSHKTLWIATVFPHLLFFFVFQNFICRFYFFNIELVENLALLFFSLKYCGLLQCFLTCFVFVFFFCMIFSKIIFVDFMFLILS